MAAGGDVSEPIRIGPVELSGPRDDCAGLFAADFPWGPWQVTVHLGVRRSHWKWGREDSWWNGPLPMWGIGPLVMVCAFWRDE